MSDENGEDWDDGFLEQLIQVEELALSAKEKEEQQLALSSAAFSPPRQLSQRIPQSHSKDPEVHRLQAELRRVCNQLQQLEDECHQLRNKDNLRIAPQPPRCNEVGVQADLVIHASSHSSPPPDHHQIDLSNKLEAILAPPTTQKLISDLSAISLPLSVLQSAEAAKFSKLYSLFTDVGSGMVELGALAGPLMDLCGDGNVAIAHTSLRMLSVFLKHVMTLETKAQVRDNVTIEGPLSRNCIEEHNGASCAKGNLFCGRNDEAYCGGCAIYGARDPVANIMSKKSHGNPGREAHVSCVDWFSTFELMNQIAMRNTEKKIKSEAVSIMNMIVTSSHSSIDRQKFGQTWVFDSISQLLRKEAGLYVQKEALHLLYLLLNCPKIMATLCSDCEERDNADAANEVIEKFSANKVFIVILEGLADCVACSGNSLQDLEIRRNIVLALAFLASSGKHGFEILINHKLHRDANFLMLILQMLASEIDMEAATPNVNADIFRARTSLIREGLILLNRLVSHPAYAAIVLQVLTSSRDMASLTIDVANRLSRKGQRKGTSDTITRQMRESEVLDLGQLFRRRVFTYLRDS